MGLYEYSQAHGVWWRGGPWRGAEVRKRTPQILPHPSPLGKWGGRVRREAGGVGPAEVGVEQRPLEPKSDPGWERCQAGAEAGGS